MIGTGGRDLLVARIVGDPKPQGSTRSFERAGKVHTVGVSGDLAKWRTDVRAPFLALRDANVAPLWRKGTPVHLRALFRFARPESHYLPANARRAERELREDAPRWHTQEPDLDKLVRAIGDALTGLVWEDDRQIVDLGGTGKVWTDGPSGVDLAIGRVK